MGGLAPCLDRRPPCRVRSKCLPERRRLGFQEGVFMKNGVRKKKVALPAERSCGGTDSTRGRVQAVEAFRVVREVTRMQEARRLIAKRA